MRPHSRTPSLRSQSATQFTPINPSGLRESYTLATSPENVRSLGSGDAANDEPGREREREVNDEATGSEHLTRPDTATDDEEDGHSHGHTSLGGKIANETTALLKKPFELAANSAHPGPCNHGTFSPRTMSRADSTRSFGGSPPNTGNGTAGGEEREGLFAGLLKTLGVRNGSVAKRKRVSTTSWLAEQHGITNTTSM